MTTDEPLTIRRLGPEDSPGIVDCIHRVYGSTYANASFYDASRPRGVSFWVRGLERSRWLPRVASSLGEVLGSGFGASSLATTRRVLVE